MNRTPILEAIDQEIARLQQARTLLAETTYDAATPTAPPARRPGRPKGSGQAAKASAPAPKRQLSEEGRANMVAAQQARRARQKHAAKKAANGAGLPATGTKKVAGKRGGKGIAGAGAAATAAPSRKSAGKKTSAKSSAKTSAKSSAKTATGDVTA